MEMRIVFIGCVTFSKTTLVRLLDLGANIVGVITKKQSSFNSDFEDLSTIVSDRPIPFKYVNDINHPNNIEWIRSCKPDVIFCFGWSSLIHNEILTLAALGVVGYHPSLLPMNRGRHPIIWAKILGLNKTGSTFFFMDENADTGDILSQVEIPIEFTDNASDIYKRMTEAALYQIGEFLPRLQSNTFERTEQVKTIGNTWRKRSIVDGLVDFRMTTNSICNLVRGLSRPYPGAHCNYNGINCKIWSVEPGNFSETNIEPGKVIAQNGKVIEIKTGDASIKLVEHEIDPLPPNGSYLL